MNPTSKETYRRLMILKYIISHSYRSLSSDLLLESAKLWTDSDKEDFIRGLEKDSNESISSMKKFGLWNYTTKIEKDFLSTSGLQIDRTLQMNTIWRMEAAVILMWALRLIEKFPDINEQTNPELLKIVEIKKLHLFSPFLSLRPHEEISKMRDLIEKWHWRVNTRRLIEDNYKYEPSENLKKAGVNSLDDIVRMSARLAFKNRDIKEIIDDDFVFKGQAFRDLNKDDFSEVTSIIIERHYALNWLCGYAHNNNWEETPTDT